MPDSHGEADGGLVELARRGDAEALKQLVLSVSPAVASSIQINERWQSVLGVEDVMQETLRDLARDIKTFAGKSSLVTWAISIAQHNLSDAIEALKAQKRDGGPPQPIEDVLDELAPTVSQGLRTEEKVRLIEAEIARLPEDYRRVLELCVIQGISAPSAAQQLSRREGWVRLVKKRALDRLRDELQDRTAFASHVRRPAAT